MKYTALAAFLLLAHNAHAETFIFICRDVENGSSATIALMNNNRLTVNAGDSLVSYVDGATRSICDGSRSFCGIVASLLGGDAVAENIVRSLPDKVVFGLRGSVIHTIDRKTGAMTANTPLLDSFVCH